MNEPRYKQQANKEEYNKNVNDMKTRLLSGLTALLLGGLTSCGNILEENGVISNVAESGMGELRINLSTDASLNVSTKAETEDLSSSYESLRGEFLVTLTAPSGTDLEGVELPYEKKFSEIENQTYTLPAVDGYTLTAKYDSMTGEFGWNCPVFEGTNPINVTAGAKTDASVTCSLKNAIINVNLSEFETSESKVKVTSLYAYSGDNDQNKFFLKGEGVQEGKVLGRDTVYVKAGISAKLILTGTFLQDGSDPIAFTTPAQEITAERNSTTTEKTKYNVKYSLQTTNGQMTIQIDIDGNVTVVPIDVKVNPYDSTTQETQSNGGGE